MSTQDVLSQDEIDALLHGVDSGKVRTDAPAAPGAARPFDFAAEDRLARNRMPALERVNERFARQFRTGLTHMLRRQAEVSAKGVETCRFADYLSALPAPSSINLLRVKPLRGTALAVFEPSLVLAVVDSFFGGAGRFRARIEGREFTPTELRVIQLMLRQLLADLHEAWAGVMKLEFESLGAESNPHFVSIVGPRDHVVASRFHVELEGGGGDLHLTLPYPMLEPVRAALDAGLQGGRGDRDERWTAMLREQLLEAEVGVTTILGKAELSLRALAALKAGDVLPIEQPRAAELRVEGLPMFRGQVGVSAGRQALKITEVLGRRPAPAKPH
jgi:flagellar motor switch protein FliM